VLIADVKALLMSLYDLVELDGLADALQALGVERVDQNRSPIARERDSHSSKHGYAPP